MHPCMRLGGGTGSSRRPFRIGGRRKLLLEWWMCQNEFWGNGRFEALRSPSFLARLIQARHRFNQAAPVPISVTPRLTTATCAASME
jgi:hypothetical protein